MTTATTLTPGKVFGDLRRFAIDPPPNLQNVNVRSYRLLSSIITAFILINATALLFVPIAIENVLPLLLLAVAHRLNYVGKRRLAAYMVIGISLMGTYVGVVIAPTLATSLAVVGICASTVLLTALLLSSWRDILGVTVVIAVLFAALPSLRTDMAAIDLFSPMLSLFVFASLTILFENYRTGLEQDRQLALVTMNVSLKDEIAQRQRIQIEREALIKELEIATRLAKENSRLKSEFLSTMSHELRTPLNAIEGFTSIMLSGMGIELSPRAEDMVRRVSSNSTRLLQLINDFLDLSRIEAGRLELIAMPVSPAVLAQQWQREVSVLAENKGLAFTVTVDPALPPTLLADEDALSKVTINLLSNAFKFTHEGQVTLALNRLQDEWEIIVTDTGIGIPAHAREYIFEEFRQVDSSSKRLYGGTGLGLSLVQKLTRAMGGSVALQTELGKGSTFTVTLPLITETSETIAQGVLA
ncbi:MAG: hypothetical protein H7Y11_09135 [Armatimonadetes bacterium]|nr:hypothetical protein [Anaerolineae bacterium]